MSESNDLATRLREHVEMLAGAIGPRYEGAPGSLEATRRYITDRFEAAGLEVRRESDIVDGYDVINLVAELPGEDPKRRDEVVLLGAHYDTVKTTPGADDNASAVAGLIEAGLRLKDMPRRRALRLVAFDKEEPPHFGTEQMGSAVHAKGCRDRGEKLVAMVCLEMIGYFSDAAGSQKLPDEVPAIIRRVLPQRGDFVALVSNPASARMLSRFAYGFNRTSRLPAVKFPLAQKVVNLWVSDHGPFWDRGFKALMVTDTAYFRNNNYHEPTDTPDTLNYERMAQATEGIVGGVHHLLNARGS